MKTYKLQIELENLEILFKREDELLDKIQALQAQKAKVKELIKKQIALCQKKCRWIYGATNS